MTTFADQLKSQARRLGFDLAGIAPATQADSFDRLRTWLDHDYAGEMEYLHRHAEARRHPASILAEVRSVVMVALNYRASDRPAIQIAQYALGQDYHDVLRGKLNELLVWVQAEVPGTQGRGVVDTAPLLERDFARRAGLGWFGKNTMLIHPRLGSFFFLGALLLDLPVSADAPFAKQHCGTCTACLEACPTQAFVEPYVLDARRCISYLTIELRGAIPEDLREGVGDWLFGCDVCQDVCPWNRKAPLGREPALQPRGDLVALDPIQLVEMSDAEFRQRFRGTTLWRTKRLGLVRNAILVLGNRGDPTARPALERALLDADPVIQDAARWALQRLDRRE